MVGLWVSALICLLSWLLMQRRALLRSPIWWKPVAFISLGFGSLATLVFWIAFAIIFLIDGDMWELFAFMDVTGYFSPSFFMVGTGIGLVYSAIHLRARLKVNHRLKVFALAVLSTIGGVEVALAEWPRFSYYFGILLQRMSS